jgi:hypothetical protein
MDKDKAMGLLECALINLNNLKQTAIQHGR